MLIISCLLFRDFMFIISCLHFRAAQKVADGVTQEIMKKFGDDKKMSKKEKDERFVEFILNIL